MKLILNFIVSLLIVINTQQAFALKILIYPSGQAPECSQSFESAASPKTPDNVLFAMSALCTSRGGVKVMHKMITAGSSNDLSDLALTCFGENPKEYTIFTCLYSVSYEDQ